MVTVLSTVTSNRPFVLLGWNISPAHAAGLSPAQQLIQPSFFLARSGPVPKIFKKNIFRKIRDFPVYFVMEFCLILVLYHKDTNPVLKYPVFVKTLKKKCFCFHAYDQVS
jgi:hypothetical protein